MHTSLQQGSLETTRHTTPTLRNDAIRAGNSELSNNRGICSTFLEMKAWKRRTYRSYPRGQQVVHYWWRRLRECLLPRNGVGELDDSAIHPAYGGTNKGRHAWNGSQTTLTLRSTTTQSDLAQPQPILEPTIPNTPEAAVIGLKGFRTPGGRGIACI
jgi:hypothetical protein